MEVKVDKKGNPDIGQFSEDGFIDCVLKIHDLKENDFTYIFHLAASHNGQILGINVEVVKNIQGGFDNDVNLIENHVYRNGVIFRRSGKESDLLISVLSELYGNLSHQLEMVEEESFTGIALHQGNINMLLEPIKIKIFGNDKDEDDECDYYESFFNLDLKNGFVFWNEKDQDYRQPLIKSLSK
jgi:hypothetical protein